MILEVAILDVKPELLSQFENTFAEASKIISSMKGYISHQLQKCLEKENRYILLPCSVRQQKEIPPVGGMLSS